MGNLYELYESIGVALRVMMKSLCECFHRDFDPTEHSADCPYRKALEKK